MRTYCSRALRSAAIAASVPSFPLQVHLETMSWRRESAAVVCLAKDSGMSDDEDVSIPIGDAFVSAGQKISAAACILPNWYSSKEGLTGESPAVFGGTGTAFVMAGESFQEHDYDGAICDLLTAGCALDPIDLRVPIEEAADAIQEALSKQDDSCLHTASRALASSASQFHTYGEDLNAEEHSSSGQERETAGNLLQSASDDIREASKLLLSLRV